MGRVRRTSSGGVSIPPGILRPLAAALLLALPDAATAQDVKPVDVRRLAFEYKCVFEEFQGKAESEFLQRLRRQRDAYAAPKAVLPKDSTLTAMEDLLAKALWERVKVFREKDPDQASTFAKDILDLKAISAPVRTGIRDEAETFILSHNLGKAEKDEKAGNIEPAWKSYSLCTGTEKPGPLGLAISGLVRISKQRNGFESTMNEGDPEKTVDMLKAVVGEIKGAMSESAFQTKHKELDDLKALLDEFEGKQGYVTLRVTNFNLGGYKLGTAPLDLKTATFSFIPVAEGKRWPRDAESGAIPHERRGLLAGIYDIRVYLPPEKDPVAVYLGVATGDRNAPTPIAIPAKIPQGMVYVGPWTSGGGFFIDRTEVTVAEVDRLKGSSAKLVEVFDQSLKDRPNVPAWFLDEVAARDWEKATGKSIPTDKQWLDAAYGPYSAKERPYPWGKDAPQGGVHFAPRGDDPREVGSHPAGRSPFGIDDMAGNVAEWVHKDDGGLWLLGGHMLLKPEELLNSGGKNWLREPAPGQAAFNAMVGAVQGNYTKFKVTPDDIGASGLRMVIVPAK